MDDLYSVPDPTDWLSTSLPSFANLEAPLHCQICKEFYDTPMITSCNHTFCSRCIRTSLSQDGKCPACRTGEQASRLRNNWALQEVVGAFVQARGEAMGVAKRTLGGGRVEKRKRGVEVRGEDVEGRTTRSKSRRIAGEGQGSQPDAIEIGDSEAEEDEEVEYRPESPEPQHNDGMVECPLECGKRMKEAEVFAHLDRCETEKKERQRKGGKASQSHLNGFGTTSTQPQTRPQDRINQLNYSMLTDAAMAKKLKEIGIPNWGNKKLMTNRHREWVNIWNANCDSTQPRKKRDLLHDLDVWERTQGGRAPSLNSSLMRKDFDGDAHSRLHHDDFSRLIADARRKKNLVASEGKEGEKGEDEEKVGEEVKASQSERDGTPLDLRIRKDDGTGHWADPVPPNSQQQVSMFKEDDQVELPELGAEPIASSQERPPTSSQQLSKHNQAIPPVPWEVLGR